MSAVNRFREYIGLAPETHPDDVYEDAREGYGYAPERDSYREDSYDPQPRRTSRERDFDYDSYDREPRRDERDLREGRESYARSSHRDAHERIDDGFFTRRDQQPDHREVFVVRPTSYDDAVTIGTHVREGNFVDMDLSEMGADAKRLVDFAAGLVFAVDGAISKVESRRFLISPAGVRLSPDEVQDVAAAGVYLER